MLVKIASSRPQDIIEALNDKESMGYHFHHNGKIEGLYVIFETDAPDIKAAKSAAKKVTKANPKLGGMMVSVLPY